MDVNKGPLPASFQKPGNLHFEFRRMRLIPGLQVVPDHQNHLMEMRGFRNPFPKIRSLNQQAPSIEA